jgi:hypothetical protein
LYDETFHTMKFSALARQVTTAAVASRIDSGLTAVRHSLLLATTNANGDLADLRTFNETLIQQLDALRQTFVADMVRKEEEIREEAALEMETKFEEMQHMYEALLARQAEDLEKNFDVKWAIYSQAQAPTLVPAATAATGAAKNTKKPEANMYAQLQASLEAQLQQAEMQAAQQQQEFTTKMQANQQSMAQRNAQIEALEVELGALRRCGWVCNELRWLFEN